MEFRPYMHVGRLIDDPETYGMLEENDFFVIQPKIDGCNGVIWWDSERQAMRMGNRTKEITMYDINEDTPHNIVSFHSYVCNNTELWKLAKELFPDCYIYGEWLVQNHIDYYAPSAWNKFYIFDIWDPEKEEYVSNAFSRSKNEYPYVIQNSWIQFSPNMSAEDKLKSFELQLKQINALGYLMNPGEKKAGEGIVIKCYDWRNNRGEQKWAKLRTDEYMQKVYTPRYIKDRESIEGEIVRKFLLQWDIDKVVAKLKQNKCFDQWDKKYIGDLLTAMWYDFINEYMPVIADIYKHERICFHELRKALNARVKHLRCDLF